MKLQRAQPLLFVYDNGLHVHVPALTRKQVREIIALDRETGREEGPMTPEQSAITRGKQVAVIISEAVRFADEEGTPWEITRQDYLDGLSWGEECDIINAVVAQWYGLDPKDAVDLQQALRGLMTRHKPVSPEAALEAHDEATIDLAVHQRVMPEQIDNMPYVDSLALGQGIQKKEFAERKFEAQVHGKELR